MTDSQETTLQCLECHKTFGPEHERCPDDNSELVPAKQDQLVGKLFAERYDILEIAGRGGMATVYKAKHKYIDRDVAIKLMHNHLVNDPTSIKRFQQEAKAASSLTHQNVISVYDFGISQEGDAFLVMDYLQGCALSDLIDHSGPIPEFEAIDMIRQVCKGLIHAHKKGVVHRDLKPPNLVMTIDEDDSVLVKIVDFGIAKVTSGDDAPSQHLTKTGEVFGSPLYMSPEQWEGKSLDNRSDIYSLGCLMYEMLTGSPPLVGETPLDTMSLHLNEKPLSIKEFNPSVNVSAGLEAIVLKCLEKNKERRYNSVAEILIELPIEAKPPVQQGETVAVRVVDLLEPTGAKKQETTVQKPARAFGKTRFRFTYEQRSKVFGIALLLLVGFICLYQGPDEDPGPPASKMIWQLELTLGHTLLNAGLYGLSMPVLELANWHAANLDPIFHRPNYEKRFQTMARLGMCYNAAGRSTKFQKLLEDYIGLDRNRWESAAKRDLTRIEEAEQYIKQLRKNRETVQTHLSEPKLNFAPKVRRIVEVARRLDANYSYELEYQLLYKTENLLEDLYGRGFVGLADIKLQRAICLKNQDRITAIDANDEVGQTDGIYGSIKEIWENYARKNLGVADDAELTLQQISQEPSYIRAILKLGQWQRRMDRYQKAENNITLAIKAAEKNKKFEPDELAEFYSSYANLLHQTNKLDLSREYRLKARAERQKSAEMMGLEYIRHQTEED